jgi:C4-dicarboxylate transporter, DctQ subunit
LLSKMLDGLLTGLAALAGLILVFITFSISYGIITRAMGFQSPVWIVQFNEYSLLWMTFLGSAWILSRRKHVAMDVLTGQLSPRSRRFAEILHGFMGVGLCGILFYYSTLMTLNLYQRGVTDVQAMDVPKYLVIMVIPIGFLVLILQFFRNLTASLRGTGVSPKTGSPSPGSKSKAPREKDS